MEAPRVNSYFRRFVFLFHKTSCVLFKRNSLQYKNIVCKASSLYIAYFLSDWYSSLDVSILGVIKKSGLHLHPSYKRHPKVVPLGKKTYYLWRWLYNPESVLLVKFTCARSFSNCAPRLWNDLPREIQFSASVGIFKRHLKTHPLILKGYLSRLCIIYIFPF